MGRSCCSCWALTWFVRLQGSLGIWKRAERHGVSFGAPEQQAQSTHPSRPRVPSEKHARRTEGCWHPAPSRLDQPQEVPTPPAVHRALTRALLPQLLCSPPGQFGMHKPISQGGHSPAEPAAYGMGWDRPITAAEAGREVARPSPLHTNSRLEATRPQASRAVTNPHPKWGHPHVSPRENSTKPGRSWLPLCCQTQIKARSAWAESWEKARPVRSSPQDALLPSSKQHKEMGLNWEGDGARNGMARALLCCPDPLQGQGAWGAA